MSSFTKNWNRLRGRLGQKLRKPSRSLRIGLLSTRRILSRFHKFAIDWALWMWDKTFVSLDDTTRQLKTIWGLWIKSIEDTKPQFEAIVAGLTHILSSR